MKKFAFLLLTSVCMLSLFGCAEKREGYDPTVAAARVESTATMDTEPQNEVLEFLSHQYAMKFTLWGPEGNDLYAFHIYPDHAERECHILMPANTDDTAQYHDDLSWEVVNDELIIAGEWQETFRIDISAKTAVSTSTGKVFKIYAIDSEDVAVSAPQENLSEIPGGTRFIVEIRDREEEERLSCAEAEELFYEDETTEYYFNVIKSHYVLVTYDNGNSEDIVTALNAGRAAISDLDRFGIGYFTKPRTG